jgi:hypothetical protein
VFSPRLILIATLLAPGASSLAQPAFPDRCPDQTPLPFASIAVPHPIDRICGPTGKRTSPPNVQLQNRVKNNFCSRNGPEVVTPQTLVDLQSNTHLPFGHEREPRDRRMLRDLGEGKVVRIKAYLIEAHHADVGTGESVNCDGKTEDQNDIHISLGALPHTRECEGVTAEISPHYRPLSWNEIGHFEIFNRSTQRYSVNHALAARLQSHPYRITGQLFFDASHDPCPCGATRCGPSRASLWEIHPVYDIEVCRTGTRCNESIDADWIAFDQWWKFLPPLRPSRNSHRHRPHEWRGLFR